MSLSMLRTKAQEESTYVIDIAFVDELGAAVAPDTMTWSLTNRQGEIINSRDGVSIGSPSSTETLVLKGDDLAIVGDKEVMRIMTFEGTYTSTNGAGLPLRDEVGFLLEPLIVVS